MKPVKLFALMILPAVLTAGCEDTKNGSQAAADQDTAVARAPIAEEAPTDREIAHILQTSNAVILRHASLAKSRLQSGAVRAFADTILANHTAYNLRAQRTFLAINTVPLDNEHSELMVAGAADSRAALEAKAGADFERAYVDTEVTLHQQVIDLLDDVLLVHARDPILQELLQEYRLMMGSHLDSFRDFQQAEVSE